MSQFGTVAIPEVQETTPRPASDEAAAAASAAAALQSKTDAAASAVAAAGSATTAQTAAAAAATSAATAGAAVTAATQAQTAATQAQASQTAAAASASASAGSADGATQSANLALAAEQLAETKAAEAAASAASAATNAANAATSVTAINSNAVIAANAATSATASKNAAATSETNAASSAQEADNWSGVASNFAGTAITASNSSQASASQSSNSATAAAGSATAAAASAAAATISAASAASSATAAANAIAVAFKGGLAGNAVPATSTAAGDWYRITSAGTSQTKTWATGDIAIYNGTSGSWTQVAGGVTDAGSLAAKTNPLASQAALACDGSSTANRLTWSLPAACALGSDARGFTFKLELPAAAPGSNAVLFTWGDAASPTAQFIELVHTSGDALRIRIYGASTAAYRERTFAGLISNYGANRVIIGTLAADSTGLGLYLNGVAATLTSETTGGSAPADWQAALTSAVAAWHGGTACKLYSWFPLNFAPTLTDALDIYFLGGGVPERLKWATQVDKNTFTNAWALGTSDSNSANTVGGGGGAMTVGATAGQRTGGAGAYYTTATSATTSAGTLYTGNMPTGFAVKAGQKVRQRVWLKSSITRTLFKTSLYSASAVSELAPSYSPGWSITSAWALFETTHTIATGGTISVVAWQKNTTSAAETMDVDDLSLVVLGALFFASPHAAGDGCGYQLHDLGSNQVDGLMPTAGWSWTHPTQRGYVRGTTSTNGNQQLAGGVILPANSQLTRIRQKTGSGTPNTMLGSISGGAQFMASAAQSTSWKDETIALTGGIVASANSIWVGSNSTDTIYTHASYEILS